MNRHFQRQLSFCYHIFWGDILYQWSPNTKRKNQLYRCGPLGAHRCHCMGPNLSQVTFSSKKTMQNGLFWGTHLFHSMLFELIFALNNYTMVKKVPRVSQREMAHLGLMKAATWAPLWLNAFFGAVLGQYSGLSVPLMGHICITDPCTCHW